MTTKGNRKTIRNIQMSSMRSSIREGDALGIYRTQICINQRLVSEKQELLDSVTKSGDRLKIKELSRSISKLKSEIKRLELKKKAVQPKGRTIVFSTELLRNCNSQKIGNMVKNILNSDTRENETRSADSQVTTHFGVRLDGSAITFSAIQPPRN